MRKQIIPPKDLRTKTQKKTILNIDWEVETPIQKISALLQNKKGGNKILKLFPQRGCSFVKSFIPSLKGCRSPKGPTKLGPFRLWEKLKIFRSNKVIKATESKTDKIKIKLLIMCIFNFF